MRRLIGICLTVILIIVITILLYFVMLMFQQRLKYNDLYNQEIYAQLNTFNSSAYQDIMTDLDAIEGVTLTNTTFSDVSDNLHVYADEVYYNKIKDQLDFEVGQGFSTNDFVIQYNDNTVLPIIITKNYAQANNIQVGDQMEIEDFLPSVCGTHMNWSTMMTTENEEEGVTVEYPKVDEVCDDLGEFTQIKTKVIGIVSNNNTDIIDQKQVKDPFLLPSFIVDDQNMHLYDLDSYLNHQPIYTNILYGQYLFIDYQQIAPPEFEQEFEAVKGKYSTELNIYSQTLYASIDSEEEIRKKMQTIIVLMYISFILLVLYFSYLFSELKYKEYKFAVYHLLGAKWKHIQKRELKKELPYIIIQLLLVLQISYIINLWKVKDLVIIEIAMIVFISLNIMKYILTLIRYKSIGNKQLNDKYIEGELWLN
ncbi:MAG: hypothetical protein ACK5HR_00010 [Mycoplasmatales bacterium]